MSGPTIAKDRLVMKKLIAVATIVVAAVLLPVTAAQGYGELAGPTSASPGAAYSYNVSNLTSTDDVTLAVDGPGDVTIAGLVTLAKTPTGGGPYAASFGVTFPTTGVYTLVATQPGNTVGTVSVTVTAVPADEIAFTGTNATPFLWFGGGLLVLGAALVAVLAIVRRNKSATPA
jgi:hypothetical protein